MARRWWPFHYLCFVEERTQNTNSAGFSLNEVTTDSFHSFLGTWTQGFLVLVPPNDFNIPELRRAHIGPPILPVSSLSWFWSLSTDLTTAESAFPGHLHPGGTLGLCRKIFCLFYRKCHKRTLIRTEKIETHGEVQINSSGPGRRQVKSESAVDSLHHIRKRSCRFIVITR